MKASEAPPCRYDRTEQQKEQVAQRRAQLGLILESQVRDPNTKAGERRVAAGLMASAVSKAWAHQQLLDAHTAQLRHQQEALSRPQNAGAALSCLFQPVRLVGRLCHSQHIMLIQGLLLLNLSA